MNGFIYLASPYTHDDQCVRERRFKDAAKAAAKLMSDGNVVFCPIAHSHPIDIEFSQPESGPFWKRQDAPFLHSCSQVVVLMIDGWDRSPGVAHEIQVAKHRGIPIIYMEAE